MNTMPTLKSLVKMTRHRLKLSKVIMTSALLSSLILPAQATNNDKPQSYEPTYKSASLISRAEAANPNNFNFISINDRTISYAIEPCAFSEGLIRCALEKLALINASSDEGDTDYDLAHTFLFPSKLNPKTAVVIVTRSGLMDDSVSDERYRVSFKRADKRANAGWQLVQYGVQYQCTRGDKPGTWTKTLCP